MSLEMVRLALSRLRTSRLRTFLTMLGVIIGVASVIAMVTLGRGATASVTNDISALGNNMLIIVPGADRRFGSSSSAQPFTQNDVRAIQLAKAALMAGIRLLMERLGTATVDRIRLAGAFGAQIDVMYAMVLGMIPDCDLEQVTSAGNAAGTGARIALLDSRSRSVIEDLVRRVEKVETALEPRFQEHFVDAMAIPHRTADFPNLAKVVALPEQRGPTPGTRAARRRNRRMPP